MAHMARSLLAVAVILALTTSFVGPSAADPVETAQMTVNNIKQLADLSAKLTPVAQTVTFLGGALLLKLQGPLYTVNSGLKDIANVAAATVTAVKTEGAVSAADADQIVAAYQQYVIAQQQLLTILISKAGLFTVAPSLVQPVEPVLQSLQLATSPLATTLTALLHDLPNQLAAIEAASNSLNLTLGLAVQAYASA